MVLMYFYFIIEFILITKVLTLFLILIISYIKMPSQNFNFIKQAIENKQQIHADFDGYHRGMCPHVLGVNKNGKEQALFCQFAGESKSQGIITPVNAQWRCIPVEELSNLKIVNGEWHTLDTKHKRRTSCVDNITIEVPIN